MHISKLSVCYNRPDLGVHCIQMGPSSTLTFDIFETAHLVESEQALDHLIAHYSPLAGIKQKFPTTDGAIGFPALLFAKWSSKQDIDLTSSKGEYVNLSFEAVSNTGTSMLLRRIKENVDSGYHPQGQEPEHLGH